MAITWGNIWSMAIFFGPTLVPKAIAYYRRTRNAPAASGLKVRPVPASASKALALLGLATLVFLALSLPFFAPENLFQLTQSRLQIPADVLFNRVASLRPNNQLSPRDELLRARFVNLESRLLYLHYGPDVVGECPWCSSEDPKTYFFYGLPAVLAPHVVNAIVLAFATSQPISGGFGTAWRKMATLAAVALACVDIYFVNNHNYQLNSRALRLADINAFYWTMRSYRFVALAVLDGLLASLVWLSCTNRAFAKLPTPAEKTEEMIQGLLRLRTKMNALGIVKNTTSRDEELRRRSAAYWAHEGKVMSDVMEDREVINSVNDALENRRVDITKITGDAEKYATDITRGLQGTTMTEETKKDQ